MWGMCYGTRAHLSVRWGSSGSVLYALNCTFIFKTPHWVEELLELSTNVFFVFGIKVFPAVFWFSWPGENFFSFFFFTFLGMKFLRCFFFCLLGANGELGTHTVGFFFDFLFFQPLFLQFFSFCQALPWETLVTGLFFAWYGLCCYSVVLWCVVALCIWVLPPWLPLTIASILSLCFVNLCLMSNLIILSWNVRGLNSKFKRSLVLQYLKD